MSHFYSSNWTAIVNYSVATMSCKDNLASTRHQTLTWCHLCHQYKSTSNCGKYHRGWKQERRTKPSYMTSNQSDQITIQIWRLIHERQWHPYLPIFGMSSQGSNPEPPSLMPDTYINDSNSSDVIISRKKRVYYFWQNELVSWSSVTHSVE